MLVKGLVEKVRLKLRLKSRQRVATNYCFRQRVPDGITICMQIMTSISGVTGKAARNGNRRSISRAVKDAVIPLLSAGIWFQLFVTGKEIAAVQFFLLVSDTKDSSIALCCISRS